MDFNADEVFRESVMVAIKIGGPLLLLCMAVGILVAIFQAVTQIHDQTLGFVLKLISTVIVFFVAGGWMLTTLVDFTERLFTMMI